MTLILREKDVESLVSMKDVVGWVEDGLRAHGEWRARNIPRHRVKMPKGTLHVLPEADFADVSQGRTAAGFVLQAGLIMGFALLAVRRWSHALPFGTFTLMLALNTYGMSRMTDEERRITADARRFARLLVSELLLYNEEAVILGRLEERAVELEQRARRGGRVHHHRAPGEQAERRGQQEPVLEWLLPALTTVATSPSITATPTSAANAPSRSTARKWVPKLRMLTP